MPKLTVSFKTPDALYYALQDSGMDKDQQEEAEKKLEKWVKYGECIDVEFDLEAMTATVL